MPSRTAEPAGSPRDKGQDWSPVNNPAVRELLDHVADELAREYIRLMEHAAAVPSCPNRLVKNSDAPRPYFP